MSLRELFEKGLSFRSFILNQPDQDRAKFMKYYIPMEIKQEYRLRLDQVNSRINILGVAEGWCPDCHINLSILEKLITSNGNISLRLITKADAEGQLQPYQVAGATKVPTFIFMNEQFEEKASFIEVPKSLKGLNLDTLEGSKQQMRYKAGKLIDETVLELLELIERTA